jgi:hypothetical protein
MQEERDLIIQEDFYLPDLTVLVVLCCVQIPVENTKTFKLHFHQKKE